MNRQDLIERLLSYQASDVIEIIHALEILQENNFEALTNEEIGLVWERVSKSIDIKFSDDEKHDVWLLETELAKAYSHE
ncbi:MAG: hypothetical protein QM500_12715 [Methylococcales bacterium]